jgi:hypothetical protein
MTAELYHDDYANHETSLFTTTFMPRLHQLINELTQIKLTNQVFGDSTPLKPTSTTEFHSK